MDEALSTRGAEACWSPPTFEVVSLDCEITAYAPDEEGERPLF